jgi:hypothetical protein
MDYRCRQLCLSKGNLEAQIDAFLHELVISERLHNWAIKHVSTSRAAAQQGIDERKRILQETQERTKSSLENLTSLRIRDLIGDDEFLRERRKLEMNQLRLRQQLDESSEAVMAFEPLETLISFRNRAIQWFRDGDDDIKRQIFGIVGSNPLLKDKILHVEAKKPFRFDIEIDSYPKLRAVRDDIRTLWVKNDPELKRIILDIHALETKLGIKREDGPPHRRAA